MYDFLCQGSNLSQPDYGFECSYPAKRQDRRTTASQEQSSPGALAPLPSKSNILTLSSPARVQHVAENLPESPTLFDGSTLPRIQAQQSMVFARTVSNERRSVEDDFELGASGIPDLLSKNERSRDQGSEREGQPNQSDNGQQSFSSVPLDSQNPVHRSDNEAGKSSVARNMN